MKKMLLGACLLSLAGCASSPDPFAQASPGCKTETVQVNGKPVTTEFCIKSIVLKPSDYRVTVNDQALFTGTGFKRVDYTKTLKEGETRVACDGIVDIQKLHGSKLTLSELPPELVTGCRITADAAGHAQPFVKDVACDEVFYKAMYPLLGPMLPVEVARQCTVTVGDQTVFDQRFKF
ncbi:MAG: hypothetical protein P0Y58_12960 [Candidatus Pseudomonas phytovorans]|uniref:Lipoprotein n=1 Tax=Candidatus Pseudomonas phytovorans TaxID=3121377 RepID=A0AAJ6BDI8_9PSED|nr:hypothetical protein [Pseudomonas sp.]WEK33048.1 MAG: hypothetical protein P0Y58_12960 [Pseudomonas sp.]